MKKAISIFALLLLGSAGGARAQSELANGIAVIVNDQVITFSDVRNHIGPAMELLREQYATRPQMMVQKMQETLKEGTEQLVERKLILNDFKVAGYNIPENVIEDSIQDRIRERFGDRNKLTRTLHAEGMTYEGFRRQVREQIIVEALRNKHVTSEILISPQKIENYYAQNREQFKVNDEVKVRMIVLNAAPGTDRVEIRSRAEQILLLARQGKSFGELAKQYSEGSQRQQGGDYGWRERSFFRKELADVAFSLKPGQVSPVIETPEAFYLMQVEEVRLARVRPVGEVRAEIEKLLLGKERTRLQQKYVDRLKKKSFVRYFEM